MIHFSKEFTGFDAFGQDIIEGWYFRNNKSFALIPASGGVDFGSSKCATFLLWEDESLAYTIPKTQKDVVWKIDTVHTSTVAYPTLTHQGLISVLCLSRGEVFPRLIENHSPNSKKASSVGWNM